jgi:hypothetical protein
MAEPLQGDGLIISNANSSTTNYRAAFNPNSLATLINNATLIAQNKLTVLKSRGSAMSIADMFDMQILMNQLSQLSEMSSAVISAANSAVSKMAQAISR